MIRKDISINLPLFFFGETDGVDRPFPRMRGKLKNGK